MARQRAHAGASVDDGGGEGGPSDEGAAMVEFLGMSLLLLVPIVYLVVAFAQVQSGAYAVDIVARESARAAVVAGVEALEDGSSRSQAMRAAAARAESVAALTMEDFGIGEGTYDVSLSCAGGPCFAPGSSIVADVDATVTLPASPPAVGGFGPLAVGVSSTSTSPVDGFASGA